MSAPSLPLHIDSTMMTAFRSCPRKFYNEFVLGLRPVNTSIDLHAGGCFASALENTYRGIYEMNLSTPDALARSFLLFTKDWGDFEIPTHKRTAKTRERMWDAVEDYFATYPVLTDHVQPYRDTSGKPTFEFTFALPLEPAIHPRDAGLDGSDWRQWEDNDIDKPNLKCFSLHPSGEPFLYSGRFDMLGNYMGRPCVRDEKTKGGGFSDNWSESWNLRNQFIGYVWACQQSGLDLDTVVVRGIAIQKTKLDHAEAMKTYSNHLVAKWKEQLRRDLWRLRRSWDEGYFDYNLGDSCTAYNHCIFLDMCASSEPERWHSNFKVHHWNPLIKNPVEEKNAA